MTRSSWVRTATSRISAACTWTGAIVLGRAWIGAGSLVAAGTVIRPGQKVPAGVLVAGVPGRVVRDLTDADRATFADTPASYRARAAVHREATWRDLPGDPR